VGAAFARASCSPFWKTRFGRSGEQSKGEFAQAEAGYATTVGAGLPEQVQKAELDTAASKEAFDAQQKLYEAASSYFSKARFPRRDLDSAQVALAQARSQYQQAQKQLDDLKNLGEKQALKSAGGQLSAATGKYQGAEAQLSYSEIRSPINGVVTDRPLYPVSSPLPINRSSPLWTFRS